MIAGLFWLVVTLFGQVNPRVILLGTGTPNPEPENSGPSVAVVVGNRTYVVDSGPGVVRRAAQAGIPMDQLTRAFLTHLHSDHTAGLPDLIFTPAVTGRKEALEIWGPPGTQRFAGILSGGRERYIGMTSSKLQRLPYLMDRGSTPAATGSKWAAR